jgi:ribonuclease P protein component
MSSEGLPRRERLRARIEFSRTLREGSRVDGELVLAYWMEEPPGAPDGANRVGIAAGRRLGGAVVRNRLKRRLREAYRRRKSELPCKNVSIVLVARSRSLDRSSREIEEDVAQLVQRVAAAVRSARESSPRSSSPTAD